MRTTKWSGLILAAVLTVTAGCSIGSDRQEEESRKKTSYTAEDADPKLAAAMNEFALNFYAQFKSDPGEETPGPNRMVSPAGLAVALSMLKGGAAGETAREMQQTLRLGGIDDGQLDQGQKILRELLTASDSSVRMEMANSIWSRSDFKLDNDYVGRMEKSYDAQIQALDFASPKAAETMNEWASDHTAGKITEVVQNPISPDAVLFLMNAMYFKGDWSEPFEKSLTEDKPFYPASGSKVQAPTMKQSGDYDYLDGDGFRAVRLPYGKSENFGMILALPDESSSLERFLDAQLPKFGQWSRELSDAPGAVELPKFKLGDSLQLENALASLGMPTVFDPLSADLSGLSPGVEPGDLFVSYVKQDTYIDVNEEGTEAAAVTSVAVEETMAAPPEPDKPFELKLNRPFFFAITDKSTGLIVFMGEVGNPLED
ncbi:proteinase inhibitor I4 serpin [Saccharibacillus sp. O23]|uniref:serpin family protein n=1 Tax=Saccharibacillus sp. O23 TaxID=2009338 RepID=UPI000B4E1064|nr:serpin family protein [Saccharibacillus sp. O23]OWR28722.1 proteinase inhibitor I4 serpin [Saccharibacillus sp. O23]